MSIERIFYKLIHKLLVLFGGRLSCLTHSIFT
jgi:hypothetical protein